MIPRPDYFGRLYEIDLTDPVTSEVCMHAVEVSAYQKSFPSTWAEPEQKEKFEFTIVGPNETTRYVTIVDDLYNEYGFIVNRIKNMDYD